MLLRAHGAASLAMANDVLLMCSSCVANVLLRAHGAASLAMANDVLLMSC